MNIISTNASKKALLMCVLGLFIIGKAIAQTKQADATCPAGIPKTASEDNFILLQTGEVYHIKSELVFMRCSIGQTWADDACLGEPSVHNWQQALQLSQENTFNGSRNWRLPNIKELSLIAERACVRPSINDALFPNTSPDDYWTSTPSMLNPNTSWAISFTNASNAIKLKESSLFVRLVRTRFPDETIVP